jgi:protein O-GlcNAc transferase
MTKSQKAIPQPTIAQLFPLALQDHHAGRLNEAIVLYRRVLAIRPKHLDALNNLGAALAGLGKLAEAEVSYRKAIAANPDFVAAHSNLGSALQAQGKLDAAIASFTEATRRKPDYADAHFNLGSAFKEQGDQDRAILSFKRAIEIKPEHVGAHNNLGVALLSLDRFDEAALYLRRAVALDPAYSAALVNLGSALTSLQQLDEAAAILQRALELAPTSVQAHSNLGTVRRLQGQEDVAIACYRHALAIDPGYADAHNNLGLTYSAKAQFELAIAAYRQAIAIKPDFAEAHSNLGNALRLQGKLDAAVAAYQCAIGLKLGYAAAYSNLGTALRDQGHLDEAVASYQSALALEPGLTETHSNLLFTMSSNPGDAAYADAVRNYGQVLDDKVGGRAFTAWQCATPAQRLQVGMVSGDLRSHPVAYFLEGVLPHLPGLGIDVVFYNTDSLQDDVSLRLQALSHGWQPLFGLSDFAAAQRIHGDGIHVLLDLSGHTSNNRLPVFAWRPAPVQASWLGYFATTGVRQMDAILVDPVSVPPGSTEPFTESPCYLPETRLCFTPPREAPDVAPLPALRNGYLTFGCFQTHAKVNDATLRLWARLLSQLPDARLRWQCKQFSEDQYVEHTKQRLAQLGIAPSRVNLLGSTPRGAYLAAHAEADVILDTSPYPGGTTTCEALWMGVPTITLAGSTMLGRQGASLMHAAGLGDWVTGDEAHYLAKALDAAGDLSALAALRTQMREQVRHAPLCDSQRFASHLAEQLWGLHRRRQNQGSGS